MMKLFSLVILLILFPPPTLVAEEPEDNYWIEGDLTLTGKQFKVVEVAVQEFKKWPYDILKYQITLDRWGQGYVVIFTDPDKPPLQKGSSRDMPTFEVELNEHFQVLKSNFAK